MIYADIKRRSCSVNGYNTKQLSEQRGSTKQLPLLNKFPLQFQLPVKRWQPLNTAPIFGNSQFLSASLNSYYGRRGTCCTQRTNFIIDENTLIFDIQLKILHQIARFLNEQEDVEADKMNLMTLSGQIQFRGFIKLHNSQCQFIDQMIEQVNEEKLRTQYIQRFDNEYFKSLIVRMNDFIKQLAPFDNAFNQGELDEIRQKWSSMVIKKANYFGFNF